MGRAGARDAEAALAGLGSRRERLLAREARPRLVRAQDVLELDDVGGRRHALEVELGDLVDVVEHLRELARHPLELVLRQSQAGEPGDVEDLVAVDQTTASSGSFSSASAAREAASASTPKAASASSAPPLMVVAESSP